MKQNIFSVLAVSLLALLCVAVATPQGEAQQVTRPDAQLARLSSETWMVSAVRRLLRLNSRALDSKRSV